MSTPQAPSRSKYSIPAIQNAGFDETMQLPMTEIVGYDDSVTPAVTRRIKVNPEGSISGEAYATKITTSGTDTYVGEAAPGTAYATASWRAQKIDSAGNVTWADSNSNFDNVATDLTSLTYG